jgi:hypothetical protein
MSIFNYSIKQIDAHIASFLPLKDLSSLAQVNKAGNEITKEMGVGNVFKNLHQSDFGKELGEAKMRGVTRVKARTAEFASLVVTGVRIKWVVTISKELWAVPMTVDDYEIKHSVASMNENCFTGGVAIYKEDVDGIGRVFINHHTGHYQVGRVGLAAFGAPAWVYAGYRPIILTFHEIKETGGAKSPVLTVTEKEEYRDIMVHRLERGKKNF